MRPLMHADFVEVGEERGFEPAALKAVAKVESSGAGFLEDGRPKIVFEGHVYWDRLELYGHDPQRLLAEDLARSAVLYRRWRDRPPDAYNRDQYDRLDEARSFDPTIHTGASFESCSWGRFQVMGYHAVTLGYPSVGAFVSEMHRDERAHLEAFLRYVAENDLEAAIRRHDWAAFARGYNGPAYRANRYDEKLAQAYASARSEFA